ncbi:MAG: hypothetical protein KatS3mg127_1692 [Silanimonas sp.]|nr:MAG: hypothetical protein KatS3mg127_1692 [Silanimonas sp.]
MASAFNLSAWALKNRALVLYAMVVLAIAGLFSYQRLGQSEDPPFTFKVMVVRTLWPGATAEEVASQLTDRIEKKLMETGQYEFIRSYSRAGESLVMFMAKDSMVSRELPQLWYTARKKIGDIRHTLPPGVVGPFFNDEFGDTFGNIYALQAEGLDYATLKDYAERIELELHRVPDVAKVELIGLQDEKIWIELSNTKLATLGVPLDAVQRAIDEQNASGGRQLLRDRERPGAIARLRRLRLGGGGAPVPDPGGRPHLPPARRGRGQARVHRSCGAAHALHGQGRHRHRRLDARGRRHHPARQAPLGRVRAHPEHPAGRHDALQSE